MFDKSVYHDPEGYALLSDNVVLIESNLDYKEEYSGKLIQEDGTESKKDMQLFGKYKDICRPTGDKYAVTPKEIEERIKGEEFARKKRVICSILESDDVTDEEVKIHLKDNKDVRDYVNERTKTQFVKLLLPAGESVYLYIRHIKRALKVAKTLSTNCISTANRILQFTGEAGRIIVAGCITRPEDENSMNPLIIDLTDATPAPEDTTAIEEAPATAPQATEEDTTTAPEEVATVETTVNESEQVTTEEATAPEEMTEEKCDAIVLRYRIEYDGNLGAEYLSRLNYTRATEQVSSIKRGGRTKVTERYYTIEGGTIYGLYRRYNRNGKRAEFAVYKDGQIIEKRTYGKNNNSYKAEVVCGYLEKYILRYEVKDGKVIRVQQISDESTTPVEFDDTNRPETPRDLPAPAPTKTTKEAPATTVQKQETSKQAPTHEATPVPEEVTTVTTSKQEGDTTPYWLLLDNELRAQQEEQEQALATPEATKQEEPAPATEATDDPEEVVFLKGAELDKVIAEYSERNNLDIEYQNKRYYFYATADGYIVKLDKDKPKSRLYIADEGPYYDSYRKGEITDRDIFFEQNMNILGDYSRQRLESPVNCNVRRTITGDLSIDPFGKIEYSYDPATGKSEEIPVKHPTTRELAIYVAARKAYEADQRERLEKYWKRYSDKVWVDTYWANR